MRYWDFFWHYFTFQRCCFHILPAGTANGKKVILVHGVLHRSVVFIKLGEFLAARGYEVFIYDYMSIIKNIHDAGMDFRSYLLNLCAEYPHDEFYLVVHSMGGLISRWALGNPLFSDDFKRINHLLMLATPNYGSPNADFYRKYFPILKLIAVPLNDLSAAAADWRQIPVPPVADLVTVSGSADIRVPENSSHLPGERAHCILPLTHCQMLFSPQAFALVEAFLSGNGDFEAD